MDGVDTRDPQGGSAWTFFNQNLVEEIQIGGLGAPAEYGGFTGAIINTVTKSGGNAFSGLFSMRYTNDSLASNNISHGRFSTPTRGSEKPPSQEAGGLHRADGRSDQEGQGVLLRRAFSATRRRRDPTGPVANSQDISPRFNLKFTLQPSSNDTIVLGMQYRLVQRDRARRVLARGAGDRSADGDRRRARVGVERAVAQGHWDQHLPRGEVHRLQRLLLSRSDRSVPVHLRRRRRTNTAAAVADSSTRIAAATRCRRR